MVDFWNTEHYLEHIRNPASLGMAAMQITHMRQAVKIDFGDRNPSINLSLTQERAGSSSLRIPSDLFEDSPNGS